jgi:alpha-tubulin suppressor-like RCC1 family protein
LVPLDGASTVALEQLSASTTHVCGLQASGALYCWGTNGQGERMSGTTGAASTTPVPSGGTGRYSSVSVGTNYTCATERVTLRTVCAGTNNTRQLGRLTTGTRDSVPQPIDQAALTSALGSQLSNSNGSSVCLTSSDDQLVCWGGSTTSLPQYTSGGPNITGAARGAAHTCVVTAEGIIRCTGSNGAGQLGDGTIGSVVVSVLVAGNASFRAVTAAANYTCALTQVGALHCWGDFPNARLRAAYGTSRRAPVPLLAGVTFTSINATPNTLCGVTTDQRYICL